MWLGRWFSFSLFWLNIWRCTHPQISWMVFPKAMARSWSCTGAMLPWTATRRSTRGWSRWTCRGFLVVPLFRFINRNNQHGVFQIMHWKFEAQGQRYHFWVSFKDPSYCDNPLGGSGAVEVEGLKIFLKHPNFGGWKWGLISWHQKNDQFRVQLDERFGMILTWPG